MNSGGAQVETWHLTGLRRVQRWRTGAIPHWLCRHVTVGVLPDGRWVADHTDPHIGARVYPTEGEARAAANKLMAGVEWIEVPAEYDASGLPTTPGWVRRGGSWFPA